VEKAAKTDSLLSKDNVIVIPLMNGSEARTTRLLLTLWKRGLGSRWFQIRLPDDMGWTPLPDS